MIHPLRGLFFSVMLCAVSMAAAAQTTYKCGNSYSETPCVDSKAVLIQDLRTDEQKRQADETTLRQKKAAGKFEKDRIAQEKRDAKALRAAGSAVIVGKPDPDARKISKVTPIRPHKSVKPPKPAKSAKPAKAVKTVKKKKAEKPAAEQ